MRVIVAVIGSAEASDPLLEAAYQTGKLLVRAGFTLLCGGLGGVMEAACRGARSEAGEDSGRIIGILPGTDKAGANPHVDIALPTGIGYARNAIIACACDGVIAVGGGSGTLSEIAMAWQYGKPIVVIEGLPGAGAGLAGKALDGRREDRILGAKDAREAVRLMEGALSGKLRRGGP